MYTVIRQLPKSQLLKEQTPTLLGALVVAEWFYKFHSFTLECMAFLATWFALDWGISKLLSWRRGREQATTTA